MEYLIGFIVPAALAVIVGFDRERTFYATVLVVIATYYVLFAVQGASARALAFEVIVCSVFSAIAILGFFILYLNRFQIEPEERVLAARFGQEFVRYRTRVRRWL